MNFIFIYNFICIFGVGSFGIFVCLLINEFIVAVFLEIGFVGVLEIGFGELIFLGVLRFFIVVGVLVVFGVLIVLGDFVVFDVVDFGFKVCIVN